MRAKLLLLFLVFSTIHFRLPAQGNTLATEYYQAGEIALLQKNYKKALRNFRQALDMQPDLMAAERGMGLCYELLNDFPNALQHYLAIIEKAPKFSRALYYQIGEVYYKMGLYQKAMVFFDQFRRLQQLDDLSFSVSGEKERQLEDVFLTKLEGNIRACQVSLDTAKFREAVNIINLGDGVNSRSDDYFPFLSNDQSQMFYTRRRNAATDENLFTSHFDNGFWHTGTPVGNVFNTSSNEGMSTLVRDGRHMYFTACNRPEVEGPCDIWEAEVDKTEIKNVSPLKGNPNSAQWESQAAISCDGSTLFFASNRPAGFGGTDLWYSTRLGTGEWSEPINLGPRINTTQDEEAPFISNDGKALYFSSTGHLGFGDQDLFVSFKGTDGAWSVPMNLGPKINTPHRELGFFLSADGRTGYFASDRPGGFGGMDIYRVNLNQDLFSDPITFVEGFVKDSVTGKPMQVTLQIAGRDPVPTDENGRFFLCLPAASTFQVATTAPEYRPYQAIFDIPEWDNKKFYALNLLLIPIALPAPPKPQPAPDTTITSTPSANRIRVQKRYFFTIYFKFDSDELEYTELDKLDDFIASVAGKDIQLVDISGFADDIGEDKYNLELSERRAKKIALYMIQRNFPIGRIAMKGNGEIRDTQPKSQNRKVELRIVTME